MKGLTDGQRARLELSRGGNYCQGDCDHIPVFTGAEDQEVDGLVERGLLKRVACSAGFWHPHITPDGHVALLCDAAVRGTLP